MSDREVKYVNGDLVDGLSVKLGDIKEAVIMCHDCEEIIIKVTDHLKNNYDNLKYVQETPINKQFEDHIDHDASITFPASFYEFDKFFPFAKMMLEKIQEVEFDAKGHIIN